MVFLAYGENVVVPFPSIVSSLGKVMLNLRARHHVSHAALNYLSKEFHTTCDVCYTWKLNKTTRKGEIVLPRLYWCRAEGQKDWVQCTKENPCKTITIEIAIQGKSGQNLRTRRTRDHTAADNSRQRREMGDGRLATLQWRQTSYFSSLRPEMVITSPAPFS